MTVKNLTLFVLFFQLSSSLAVAKPFKFKDIKVPKNIMEIAKKQGIQADPEYKELLKELKKFPLKTDDVHLRFEAQNPSRSMKARVIIQSVLITKLEQVWDKGIKQGILNMEANDNFQDFKNSLIEGIFADQIMLVKETDYIEYSISDWATILISHDLESVAKLEIRYSEAGEGNFLSKSAEHIETAK